MSHRIARWSLTPLIAAAFVLLVAGAAQAAGVGIHDFAFSPSSITIHVGDTVTWSNSGPSQHTVTANSGAFDSGPIDPGHGFSVHFTTAGVVAYHCNIHPTMTGSVTVLAAPTSPPPGGGSGGSGGGGPNPDPTSLAFTGSGSLVPLALLGTGLALLGLGLLVAARRRPAG